MPTMQDVRAKYPEYDDMSDEQLADALHRKFYSDMPKEEFAAKIGLGQQPQQPQPEAKSVGGFLANIPKDAYRVGEKIVSGAYAGGRKLVTDPVGAMGDVQNFKTGMNDTLVGSAKNAYNDLVNTPMLSVNGQNVIPAIGKQHALPQGPDMQQATQVGAAMKDRYWDNLGTTLYEEPVQSALEASSLLYGGQGLLARGLGAGHTATKLTGNAAGLLNPFNAVTKPVNALRQGMAESRALRQMRKEAPAREWVKKEKNELYSALDNAEIKFDADSYEQMLGGLSEKLKTFRAKRAPMTADAVENMMTYRGKSPTFRDVEEMLIEAKGILREPNATNADKAAAGILLDELAPFFDNSPMISNGTIAAGDVAAVAKEARDLARRDILAREASEIERKSKWYTSGDESGTRNQFATFGKRQKGLTEAEEKAAKKVVRREGAHGLLNTAGSKLTQTILLGTLGWNVGLPALLAGGALSAGSRAASAAMTNAKAKQFMQTVLAGREAQAAALAKGKRLPIKTKGLLLGTTGASLLTGPR